MHRYAAFGEEPGRVGNAPEELGEELLAGDVVWDVADKMEVRN
jgi:hypothetical protein